MKKYKDNPPEYGSYYDQPQIIEGATEMDNIQARFRKKPIQEFEEKP